LIRDPGGTAIAEKIRGILLDRSHMVMAAETELFLFSASRAQLVAEVIRPALGRGETVVCDRFDDSTTAYQGYGRGLPLDLVRAVNRIATGGLRPEVTVLVDISVEDIERRMKAVGAGADRMESAGRDFYERVRRGFFAIAAENPGRYICVNGAADVDEVERSVWHTIAGRLSAKHIEP
jgi:dTMP kinase